MVGPHSFHSWLPTQQLWNDDREVTMLPPIQARYLLSEAAHTETPFTLMLAGDISPTFARRSQAQEPQRMLPPVIRMLEQSSFLTSTSQLFTVSAVSAGAPLNPSSSSPQMNPQRISFLSIVIVCRSGSSYSTKGWSVSPPVYQCLRTDRAYLTSAKSWFWWKLRNDSLQGLPESWYLFAGHFPSFYIKKRSISLLSWYPPQAETLADFCKQQPSCTATERVKFSPESRTKAVERPVAKQERTGALRQKTLATPSLSKKNSAVFSLNSLLSWGLAAMSQLRRTEQSLRLAPSSLRRWWVRKVQSRGQLKRQPSGPLRSQMLRMLLSSRSFQRYLSPTLNSCPSLAIAESAWERQDAGVRRGASSPPQPMRERELPRSTTREERS